MTATRVAFGLALALASLAAACTSDPEGVSWTPPICAAVETACGHRCVDVASDAKNCGACGVPCAPEQTCEAGACRCAPGLVDCNGSCLTDGSPCGAAGSPVSLVTSAPGAYWQTDGALTEVTSGNADVTVDETRAAQTWEGF